MTVFEEVFWARKFGGVRRFHVEPFIGQETVFHHSASVALLLIKCLGNPSAPLLQAAILHDLEEGITGDVPAPMHRELLPALHKAEERVRHLYNLRMPALTIVEAQLLKAADFLDCALTAHEQLMLGNRYAQQVIDRLECFEAVEHIVMHCGNVPMQELWDSIREPYSWDRLLDSGEPNEAD